MSKLIAWNMVTLNGFFTGPKGEIDWFVFDNELERYVLETQETAGMLLFGRVTYQMMAAYWPSEEGRIAEFMNSMPKVVFSRTLKDPGWNNARVMTEATPEAIARLRNESNGDVFVFGSADFSATLVRLDLIDEYRFGINPVVLDSGVPWFKDGFGQRNLQLVETKPLASGVVILHYAPAAIS
jgi:dihydrofolate reductase